MFKKKTVLWKNTRATVRGRENQRICFGVEGRVRKKSQLDPLGGAICRRGARKVANQMPLEILNARGGGK